MSKIDRERLCRLRNNLEVDFQSQPVHIFMDMDETYLHIIHDGKSVCKIRTDGDGYDVTFTSEFTGRPESLRWLPGGKSIARAIENVISDYEKGQKNMTTLGDLRDYLHKEIGGKDDITIVYDRSTGPYIRDRIRIQRLGCWVCSIYRDKDDKLFEVIYYDPFTCRSAGYSSHVSLTVAEILRSIKNRINVSDGMMNVHVSDDTVEKQIYMMTARGSGKTRWVSEQLKNAWLCKNNIKNNIKDVIFNDPATIVFWVDGSKTVVKCQKGETFDPEKGLAMAISKKVLGNDYGYYETFAKHVGRYNKKHKEK